MGQAVNLTTFTVQPISHLLLLLLTTSSWWNWEISSKKTPKIRKTWWAGKAKLDRRPGKMSQHNLSWGPNVVPAKPSFGNVVNPLQLKSGVAMCDVTRMWRVIQTSLLPRRYSCDDSMIKCVEDYGADCSDFQPNMAAHKQSKHFRLKCCIAGGRLCREFCHCTGSEENHTYCFTAAEVQLRAF